MTDKELIIALSEGRPEAFTFLYKKYFRMAEWYVTHNSGNRADAEDIFQDALVIFYEKTLDTEFALNCAVKTYIYAVVRNLWLKKIRDQKIKLKETNFEEVVVIEEDLSKDLNEEKFVQIEKAIKLLGEKCQALLTQFYFYKKKMTLIAEELGYTNAANAKNQKYKCMQQLKALLNHG